MTFYYIRDFILCTHVCNNFSIDKLIELTDMSKRMHLMTFPRDHYLISLLFYYQCFGLFIFLAWFYFSYMIPNWKIKLKKNLRKLIKNRNN